MWVRRPPSGYVRSGVFLGQAPLVVVTRLRGHPPSTGKFINPIPSEMQKVFKNFIKSKRVPWDDLCNDKTTMGHLRKNIDNLPRG